MRNILLIQYCNNPCVLNIKIYFSTNCVTSWQQRMNESINRLISLAEKVVNLINEMRAPLQTDVPILT